MLARDRWLYHFGRTLRCANCGNQRVTVYRGTQPINEAQRLTVDEIRQEVDNLEAWCDHCVPKETRRTRSEARKAYKQEAALIADLSVAAQITSRYDDYVTDQGVLTKQEYYREWEKTHKNTQTRSFPYKAWTLEEMKRALKAFE